MLQLSKDDRQAVDILLGRSSGVFGPGQGNGGNARSPVVAPAHLQPRLARVQQLLELLQNMPAADPPPHLLRQIVAATERSRPNRPARPDAMFPGESTPVPDSRPMA